MPLTTGYPMGEPNDNGQTAIDAARDQAVDAALDSIEFEDDDTLGAGESPGDTEPEGATPEDSGSDATSDSPGDTADDDPDDSGDDKTATQTDDLDKARRALARAKVPKKIIESLSDEELLAWGAETARNQADVDRAFTRLKKLETQGSEPDSSQTDESQTTDDAGSDTAASVSDAGEVDLSDEASAFRDEFGDEAADALVNIVQKSQEPLRREFSQLKKTLDVLTKANEATVINSARTALVERYPDLTDEQFEQVKAKATTLAKTGDYRGKSQDVLFSDAAKLAIGEPDSSKARQALRDEHRSRSRGTPSTSGRKVSKTPRSNSQRLDAAADAALDGRPAAAIRQAYAGGA